MGEGDECDKRVMGMAKITGHAGCTCAPMCTGLTLCRPGRYTSKLLRGGSRFFLRGESASTSDDDDDDKKEDEDSSLFLFTEIFQTTNTRNRKKYSTRLFLRPEGSSSRGYKFPN